MRCGAFALAVLIAAPGLASCVGARDATEKELSALHRDLAKLRADQARTQERLDTLEITRGALRSGGEAPVASPQITKPIDPDRPDLDVVRLTPEADAESDDTDADTPRPVVRSVGSAGSTVDSGAKPTVVGNAKKKPGSEKKKKP